MEKTRMLGLGFIPNRYERRKQTKDQAAIRSGAGEAQEGFVRHWLTGVISITGAQVEAWTRVLKKKKEVKEDLSAWRGSRPCMAVLASTTGEDRQSTGQAAWRELRKKKGLARVSLTERPFIPPQGRVTPLVGWAEALGLCLN
jgi:hypothetical protein